MRLRFSRRWKQVPATALVTLAALLAAPAAAAPASPDGDDADDGDRRRKDPNEMVCRYERVTGSHMRQRICHTRGEWDQLREASQRAIRDRPYHNTDPPK
jgi:hypothetical protein